MGWVDGLKNAVKIKYYEIVNINQAPIHNTLLRLANPTGGWWVDENDLNTREQEVGQ